LLRSLFCITLTYACNFAIKIVMVEKDCVKKGKPRKAKPEANTLEKEISEMIDREKTKGKIMSKLLNNNILPTVKTDN